MPQTTKTIKQTLKILTLLFVAAPLLSACGKSDIKDNFCGVHINFQYCKCAFHNEYCGAIGMSRSEAKDYVYSEYDKWKNPPEEEEYGVIEKDGKLYLKSKPGETLKIATSDLPGWARGQLVVVGAMITCVGPPNTVTGGDSKVLLNGLPVTRVNDTTAHGGTIVEGSSKIFVNGVPAAVMGSFVPCPMVSPGPVPHVGGIITANP